MKKKHEVITILKSKSIREIAFNSKLVQPGSAFFITAYKEEYLREAISRGATLIIAEQEISNLPSGVDSLVVKDVREALGVAAAFLYPNKPKYLVAVTGTSGKTSIVDYFRQIGCATGVKVATIGTMGMKCSDASIEKELKQYELDINTPDVITMHKVLNYLAKAGVDYVAFEASSHGIHQKRIAGIEISIAVFTNFSQDHLDYHGTMDEYKNVKLRLFSDYLRKDGTAIIYDELLKDKYIKDKLQTLCNSRLVSVGKEGSLKITKVTSSLDGQDIELLYKNKLYNTQIDIIGSFQAINFAMAIAMLDKCGISPEDSIRASSNLKSVKGRLDRVTPRGYDYHIFVDHAHKPEALQMSLDELRKFCVGNLIVVFGCGGNRDSSKRKIMGEIAARMADIVIVTDDNPRNEDPASIRRQIIEGAPLAIEIGPRSDAIEYAINQIKKGDILLIAGKGHETYQIIGEEKLPFDDKLEAERYISILEKK